MTDRPVRLKQLLFAVQADLIQQRAQARKTASTAAIAAVLLGWILLLPLSTPNPLVRWSYDGLQLLLPGYDSTNVVIVHMDEPAMQDYHQQPGPLWSRAIHARLLNRLTQDQPRVVVFDVVMSDAGDPAADDAFARALQRNGRVVLAGGKSELTGVKLGYNIVEPYEPFRTNAARWGPAEVLKDPDQVARRSVSGPYLVGETEEVGLAWAAATVAGAAVPRDPNQRLAEERWFNFHGTARPFEHLAMTYTNAESIAPGFFRDKAVFIGGKPNVLLRGDVTDVFATPFTKWNGEFIPGVEVVALAYANLLDESWLRRTGLVVELLLLLVTGSVAGLGLQRVPSHLALWLAAGLALLVVAGSIAVVLTSRYWAPWMIVVVAQIPCALLWRLRPSRAAEPSASAALAQAPTPARAGQLAFGPGRAGLNVPAGTAAPAATLPDGRPEIADQTLIRCIGEGAYGQVWIARNAIGLFHAVKVVYRSRFGTDVPYERALRGIQKFMPISRSHEGFVHLLHVGRNDSAGYFFYVMEAGDDVQAGQKIDPATYAPETLASALRARGPLALQDGLRFMLALTAAVEHLHQHQLIHRDIKPANIIFVNGRPKLADIDLVTTLGGPGEVSHIGTEGYLAPEGPGTAAADVFSLGRVLYVALTGKSPSQCPELPTQVANHPDCSLFMEIHLLICKACEFDVDRRYPSAASFHAELLRLSQRAGSSG